MVSLSIVGPGTAPVAAAAPNGEGGSSGISVQADAPLQPTLDKLIAGTANPAAPTDVCKQGDFGFVVDRSGSIGSAGAEGAEESGITGFVDAFAAAGGDAVYAGAKFNDQAAATFTNGFVSPSSFKSAVNALNGTSGRTPTGKGIKSGSGNTANNRSAPNVLFVVTDGSPNVPWSSANINTNYPSDPNGWLAGANDAIAEANAARAAGWIVLSIYVGAPDSGLPFSSADDQTWVQTVMKRIGGGSYTSVANFNGLAEALLISTGCTVPPGSLEITKNVTGDTDGFAGGTFNFSADCGQAGTFTTSITLAAGVTTGKATIADIPANASCTVTETSKPPAGTDFQWKAAVVDPSPVKIESGKKAGVTVTNPRDFVENPLLGVEKTAKTANFDAAGDLLSYEIVATNLGNVTLTNVQISDPKLGALTCSPVLGSSLAPNAKMTCTGTYTTVQGDVDAGKVDNKATADSNETTPVDDTATVPAVYEPGISITKLVSTDGEEFFHQVTANVGQELQYRIVVENTGNVTLTKLTLSDNLYNDLLASFCDNLPETLAVGQSFTCEYHTDAMVGTWQNTATADSSETNPVDDTATVVVHAPTSIIVQKLLDLDGKLSTKKDQVPAAGWTFDLSGDPGMTGKTAGSKGLYTFDLTGLDGSDVFDLSETVKKDFKVLTATCEVTDAVLQPSSTRVAQVGDSRGTFVKASAEMQEIEVNAGETITCVFINTSGQVERATATPRVTPPPTDAAPTSGTPGGDSWRIVLLAIAALLAMTLLITPATPKAVRRRR